MATVPLVSVTEYLNTSYRPDQEMLEGQLVERNVGEYDHSNLQGTLVIWLGRFQREWKIRILPEQRLRVSSTRLRIPDVCVIAQDQQVEAVFTKPPLLVIEVLSNDDTIPSTQERVDDYRLSASKIFGCLIRLTAAPTFACAGTFASLLTEF